MAALDQSVAVRPGEHACSRLARADDQRMFARAFVRGGLANGHKVVYLSDRDRDRVIADLTGQGDEVQQDGVIEAALASDQLDIRGASDTYMPDGTFDVEHMLRTARNEHDRALSEGYPALSLTGEMAWALCGAPGTELITEYERRLDETAQEATLVILCQYDQGGFARGPLGDIAAAHSVDVSPELAPIARTGYLLAARTGGAGATLRLAGELDFACADVIAGVLDAHFHGPLRVDLTDLRYADVTGLRTLRGRKEQTLTIAGASEAVMRLVALLAWDTDSRVELARGS